MQEFLSNPAFKCYTVIAVLLIFNPLLLAGLTGGWRGKYKSPASPEDEKLTGNPWREHPAAEVDRVGRAHRNALENIPIALMGGLLYVLCGATPVMVGAFMGTIVVFRWIHSICYLNAIQPWRSASFAISSLALGAMLIHTLVLVLGG
jgi:glutathione S-transferase